ncbi:MAG: hypothetical protein PVG49_12255 [Desulfobacteraceae bacterium]
MARLRTGGAVVREPHGIADAGVNQEAGFGGQGSGVGDRVSGVGDPSSATVYLEKTERPEALDPKPETRYLTPDTRHPGFL